MDKATLRSEIRRLKRTFPREQLDTWSQTITRALLDDGRIGAARRVLLYHPLPDEVDTTALIARLQATHDIILPVVVGDDLVLRQYDGRLVEGTFGILEPTGPLLDDPSGIDLAIIPGMAFDTAGNRLGRGKGYYDRLLPRLDCTKVGICFPFQLRDAVPHEAHDIPMDAVATIIGGTAAIIDAHRH